MIKSLLDSATRTSMRMGYNASQKGLNIEMVVNTTADEFSSATADGIISIVESIEENKQ